MITTIIMHRECFAPGTFQTRTFQCRIQDFCGSAKLEKWALFGTQASTGTLGAISDFFLDFFFFFFFFFFFA